jgi:glycosyltransferase involved in cell wall biosynthesis
MRIAGSGLVGQQHGSVSSAGYAIVRELVERGHEFDFFSRPGFVSPTDLGTDSNVRYVDCDTGPRAVAGRKVMRRSRAANAVLDTADKLAYTRNVARSIRAEQARRPYDAVLFLGQWAYAPIDGVAVVSWVQGPPGTDVRSVLRHRSEIRRRCGLREYVGLRAYSLYRSSFLGQPRFKASDVVICGSQSSLRTLADTYGVSVDALHALPYPIDLTQFGPASLGRHGPPYRLLWVGRVVPRKRLDLFLAAGEQLIDAGWDVTLDVIGDFPFAGGFKRLLFEFPYPYRLRHYPHVPREAIHTCYRGASVLVQPSEEENFGSGVAEALACGTPVVVGSSNGTKDYIGGGGVIFHDYQPSSIAAAVADVLVRDRPRHEAMSLAARDAAEEHFDVERVVDRLEWILSSSAALHPTLAAQALRR